MDTLHQLVRVVARAFYDDKQIVIFDTIVRETMVPEDVLIDRMQIVIRELNRILAHLMKDRLIKCETKQQPRADGKIINRNYFYIDYKQFVDIVKYRIYKMRHSVEEMIKKEMESKGYICPQCKTVFNALDVSRLINVRTGGFDCDLCPESELQAYDPLSTSTSSDKKESAGPHELHSRLMEQTRLIVELLKRADEISIPAFNPSQWLEQNFSKYSLVATETGGISDDSGPQLAIAGANGAENSQIKLSVEIADEEALKASLASVSNPLPEWHMYSTVTGEAIRNSSHPEAQTPSTTSNTSQQSGVDQEENNIADYYSQMTHEKPSIEGEDEESFKQPQSKQARIENINESSSKSSSENDVLVMVAGEPIPLDKLTDEDKDRMTEEEYAQYYEIYMTTLQ